jgi:hypothetical protein
MNLDRVPELWTPADLSDYFLRHRGSAISADTAGSDWFERHPESLKAGNAADLSDYYQRHRGSAISADTRGSDWFERHPESLKAGNAADLSDYYQRHPNGSPNN